ncbi:non-heme iron oxygenase ferredoxin subunit [Mycolicibacterium sp. BiH015]|uniref:non-heme iron oxygenase ferredoxin subunit n=1 Tax=Mycolicibacterium sp. BiH015 TaxID=3018808 RepID=UPI0022E04465|nr:non-heme iron oxygenase ferredoxin subunit [Mycolicibacterium sp. BiH015]MDA2893270.1 non-heme iron oxygenase ferredoxin subunit [Mycolicibacterium sp. BiH015]
MEETRGCRMVKVTEYSDLTEQEPVGVEADGEEIMVVRIGETVYALENLCSHAEAWLDAGELHADSLEIECPLHEGKFDLRTGLPTALPCIDPVKKYDVVVDGDDVLIAMTDDE